MILQHFGSFVRAGFEQYCIHCTWASVNVCRECLLMLICEYKLVSIWNSNFFSARSNTFFFSALMQHVVLQYKYACSAAYPVYTACRRTSYCKYLENTVVEYSRIPKFMRSSSCCELWNIENRAERLYYCGQKHTVILTKNAYNYYLMSTEQLKT